jgi:hypothetical protein
VAPALNRALVKNHVFESRISSCANRLTTFLPVNKLVELDCSFTAAVRAGSLLTAWNAGGKPVVSHLTNSHPIVRVFCKKNIYFLFGKERAAQNDLLVSTY